MSEWGTLCEEAVVSIRIGLGTNTLMGKISGQSLTHRSIIKCNPFCIVYSIVLRVIDKLISKVVVSQSHRSKSTLNNFETNSQFSQLRQKQEPFLFHLIIRPHKFRDLLTKLFYPQRMPFAPWIYPRPSAKIEQ